MTARDQIIETLRQHDEVLRTRFKVKSIGLFGSFVRGEQSKRSDIDLLVEFAETVSMFEFIRLEDYLAKALGHQVDLVMKSALKPRLGERILAEVAYP
jgi:predicted nucleotidyltransferase